VLAVLNVWRLVNTESGPDPEVEALHSEGEAALVCREAVRSELAAQNPSFLPPGRPEYLQGGEYDVRFDVELQEGSLRVSEVVLCQVQFSGEAGWIVEDVSLD
jgi:hypothetical protein